MRDRTKRSGGFSFTEVLLCVVCLGIILGAGTSVVLKYSAHAVELEAYTQAVLAAQQALEVRRARGRFPGPAEIERYRGSIGLSRSPAVQTREERFRDTPLSRVTVTVTWRSGSASTRREVRLCSLVRPAR